MRILHVDNLMIRRYGKVKVGTGRKLFAGMIRNNHKVLEFSERDIARFEAPLKIRPIGIPIANKKLIETADNFRPDLILMGHCDMITNETLLEIRALLPNVKIVFRFLDALWIPRHVERIRKRMGVMDAVFITTGGEENLRQFCTGKNVVAYIPNATDPAQDDQNNAEKTEFERDLMFCGVAQEDDERYPLVKNLHESLDPTMRFDSFGMHGTPPVYGLDYDQVLATSKMGINLNRFEGWPLYSSDRIAQLMGNGLLTFLWDKGDMRRFFTDEHVAFFRNFDELISKAKAFQQDDAQRRAVAGAGRAFYHEHFSGQRIIQFMIETTLGQPYSHDYIWSNEVYR
ncbi:MAG: glycosyltransferase family 1 protein [Kiritimatiellales bacterium]|nr:glycosyltransferase family 1 protein [Kiritimatiellota bacterium]MBL7012344.1 glycosyltransferase family 1 protein [Kiritimatiellales bacterium]